ncbi:MAG: succinylglutamate desuccinylase/aspartoacylase family protein [Gammaproteobacteria bacterium]
MKAGAPLVIGGVEITPGKRHEISLPVADLYTHTPMTLPVYVVAGRRAGPTVFVSAAIHGDEINGVEIIHRLLRMRGLSRLHGTLVCIPIVNIFGFLNQTRYLPDGRDLNRSFPGSQTGSLTARLANTFLTEIAAKCDYGIDLHTASAHRSNLPQIRANLDDAKTLEFAQTFHAPILINSNVRDGSLREAADELGVAVVVFEGGERLRFNESVIRAGVHGVTASLRALGMLRSRNRASELPPPIVARSTRWVRAGRSGIHRIQTRLGQRVRAGDCLGIIADPSGAVESPVIGDVSGIVIGQNNLPLINEGDALFHVARFEDNREAAGNVEAFQDAIDAAEPPPSVEPPTY